MKTCTKCKLEKPETEFYNRVDGYREKLQSRCRKCVCAYLVAYKREWRKLPGNKEKLTEQKRRYRLAKDPAIRAAKERSNNLIRCFGITPEGYDALFQSQGGVCAICKKPETAVLLGKIKNLSIDHCHDTHRVRGLLCSRCNTAVGLLKDDVEVVANALNYLLQPLSTAAQQLTYCRGRHSSRS